jgi:iron complex outermembrane receptor protein
VTGVQTCALPISGLELAAGVNFFKNKLKWDANLTISRNKIKDFTQYVDNYNEEGNFTGQISNFLGETDLSFSPDLIIGSNITYKPIRQLSFSFNSKYIGKQFIDNTSNPGRALHDYFINGLSVSFTISTKVFREIGFNAAVNNLFNQMYETNAWVYPYYYDHQYYESNGYFPQAGINFLFGISLKI